MKQSTFSRNATFNGVLQLATPLATTSGTTKDFTIPAGVKRVQVMAVGISVSGTSVPMVRLGTGGTPATTGYIGNGGFVYTTNTNDTGQSTAGFIMSTTIIASDVVTFQLDLELESAASNTWVAKGMGFNHANSGIFLFGGRVSLSGALDIVRLTTVNGTDTFDAGEINVAYESIPSSSADLAAFALNPGGRLTLASGDPYYDPQNTVAVSGQDTTADTVTVTAHGWKVGTMVVSSATSGGITAATTYYCGNITTNTVTLHTTLAAAIAGTSKLDITGAVTANLTAFGVANQTIYYTPAVHNQIALWTGSAWTAVTFSELSQALGTLTGSIGYDVFAYINSAGAAALELLAWSSATARATAVTLQDGRWCKSGDKTRLLLGSFYTRDTTLTESSLQNRLVSNIYNSSDTRLMYSDATSHTYATNTYRQWNNAASSKITYFNSIPRAIFCGGTVEITSSATGFSIVAFCKDSTSTLDPGGGYSIMAMNQGYASGVHITYPPDLGYHYISVNEKSTAGTGTFTAMYIHGNIQG